MTRHPSRLVAVNRYYRPDTSATGQLLSDVCEAVAADETPVLVVTSRQCYEDPRRRLSRREELGGVQIHRVPATRFGRGSPAGRAIDYVTFHLSAFFSLCMLLRSTDVLVVTTDPPLLSVPASIACKLRGARLVVWSQDVFPEIAGALGMRWARGPVGRILERVRTVSLKSAGPIVAISPGMALHLERSGAPGDRIQTIPNWAAAEFEPVEHRDNAIRKAWSLDDRLVIAYSGNLGRAHAAERVAALIERLGAEAPVTWLFIGGGAGLKQVRALAQGSAIDIRFKPYQPREALRESLSAADCHLVSLDPTCDGLMMPSKIYGAMAAGRPILSLSGRDGDLTRFVADNRVGVALDIGAPETWAEAIMSLLDPQQRAQAGERARALYLESCSRETALSRWRAALDL